MESRAAEAVKPLDIIANIDNKLQEIFDITGLALKEGKTTLSPYEESKLALLQELHEKLEEKFNNESLDPSKNTQLNDIEIKKEISRLTKEMKEWLEERIKEIPKLSESKKHLFEYLISAYGTLVRLRQEIALYNQSPANPQKLKELKDKLYIDTRLNNRKFAELESIDNAIMEAQKKYEQTHQQVLMNASHHLSALNKPKCELKSLMQEAKQFDDDALKSLEKRKYSLLERFKKIENEYSDFLQKCKNTTTLDSLKNLIAQAEQISKNRTEFNESLEIYKTSINGLKDLRTALGYRLHSLLTTYNQIITEASILPIFQDEATTKSLDVAYEELVNTETQLIKRAKDWQTQDTLLLEAEEKGLENLINLINNGSGIPKLTVANDVGLRSEINKANTIATEQPGQTVGLVSRGSQRRWKYYATQLDKLFSEVVTSLNEFSNVQFNCANLYEELQDRKKTLSTKIQDVNFALEEQTYIPQRHQSFRRPEPIKMPGLQIAIKKSVEESIEKWSDLSNELTSTPVDVINHQAESLPFLSRSEVEISHELDIIFSDKNNEGFSFSAASIEKTITDLKEFKRKKIASEERTATAEEAKQLEIQKLKIDRNLLSNQYNDDLQKFNEVARKILALEEEFKEKVSEDLLTESAQNKEQAQVYFLEGSQHENSLKEYETALALLQQAHDKTQEVFSSWQEHLKNKLDALSSAKPHANKSEAIFLDECESKISALKYEADLLITNLANAEIKSYKINTSDNGVMNRLDEMTGFPKLIAKIQKNLEMIRMLNRIIKNHHNFEEKSESIIENEHDIETQRKLIIDLSHTGGRVMRVGRLELQKQNFDIRACQNILDQSNAALQYVTDAEKPPQNSVVNANAALAAEEARNVAAPIVVPPPQGFFSLIGNHIKNFYKNHPILAWTLTGALVGTAAIVITAFTGGLGTIPFVGGSLAALATTIGSGISGIGLSSAAASTLGTALAATAGGIISGAVPLFVGANIKKCCDAGNVEVREDGQVNRGPLAGAAQPVLLPQAAVVPVVMAGAAISPPIIVKEVEDWRDSRGLSPSLPSAAGQFRSQAAVGTTLSSSGKEHGAKIVHSININSF